MRNRQRIFTTEFYAWLPCSSFSGPNSELLRVGGRIAAAAALLFCSLLLNFLVVEPALGKGEAEALLNPSISMAPSAVEPVMGKGEAGALLNPSVSMTPSSCSSPESASSAALLPSCPVLGEFSSESEPACASLSGVEGLPVPTELDATSAPVFPVWGVPVSGLLFDR